MPEFNMLPGQTPWNDVFGQTMAPTTAPKVDFIHPAYRSMKFKWRLMDDVIAGQEAVKERAAEYLPIPNISKDQGENLARYASYLQRALFYNATRRTLAGLIGEVFSSNPIIELPPTLEPLELDCDGGGVTLDQQARGTLAKVLSLGRAGLFVDYPTADGKLSRKDQLKGNLRPVIYSVHPADVINWRIQLVGSRRLLTLVVMEETFVLSDDGFQEQSAVQYRALRLNIDNPSLPFYYQQLYRKDKNGNLVQFGPDIIPKQSNGQTFDEILFTFAGADNNDTIPAEPPLYDMACVNIGHYRNSADYEECCFMLGNPTPWFSGISQSWIDKVFKGSIFLGSREAILLPEKGQAGLLQVAANTMVLEAMKHKEDQMRGLGAKLVDIQSTNKTATQDQHETLEDSSVLSVCSVNVSSAYSTALRWCAQYDGSDETKTSYLLNTDFSTAIMSPADRLQLMKEWQGSAISWTEYRARLRRSGEAFQDDDVALAEIDAEDKKDAATALAAENARMAVVASHAPLDSQKDSAGPGGNSVVQNG